jgi:peptidyl-prolyl cis-trans isomerase C/peptidyl-prolyl cis-trans isomerase D
MKKLSSIYFLSLGLLTTCIISGFAFAETAKEEIIANVGSKKITLEEFNKKYDMIRSRAINPPTKAQFLEDLVRYEIGLQEAEKKNLEKDPIVQDRMKEELYKALLEKELAGKIEKINVSDKEMEDYYKKNPEIRLSYILVELKPGATPEQKAEAKKRAGEIYEEVKKSSRPFEELVKLYSDDSLTKQTGGDAGWQSRMTVPPNVYDAIAPMKINEIKGLIEVTYGYQIVKVTGRRSYENANKRALRAAVFDEKRKIIFNEYFDKLKKNYPVKTNTKLIE